MTKRVIDDFRIDSISLIPSPKCALCDTRMEAHDAHRWHCVNPMCANAGKPIHTGGYPFMVKKGEGDVNDHDKGSTEEREDDDSGSDR